MTTDPLLQRTVFEDVSRIAVRLPLGEELGGLHPGGCFPLLEDPRTSTRASIIGMMVLRPANTPWIPAIDANLPAAIRAPDDWCFDVAGIGGSWPISGGNPVDAYRLALQYGTVDAVLAGSATIVREGVVAGARTAHVWQPYTPLSWAALKPRRDQLEPAIAAVRRQWQELGILSPRRYPAQIAVSRSGETSEPDRDLLDARIFWDRHPDGSAMEAYVLTSTAGAERLQTRAKAKGRDIRDCLLVASAADDPASIDVALVPVLLRSRLDARLVEHDGGATSLGAFVRAGAVAQLNLTLMGGRSVRDVVAASSRLDGEVRQQVLASWSRRPRLFPSHGGALANGWKPFYAVAEEARGGEAIAVSFDVRTLAGS